MAARGSSRVSAASNPSFHRLIRSFEELTGVPIVVSTSFNVSGEPIVETPRAALWALLTTELDACVLEDTIVMREPWFNSLLDLAPVRRCTIGSSGNGAFRARTTGPHGPIRYSIGAREAALLGELDGSRTNSDLVELIPGTTLQDIAGLLTLLFRYSLIDLR